MHGRWGCRNTWIGRIFLNHFIIKKPGQGGRCLRLHRDTLLQLSCIFIDKAEQYMLTAHALTGMANTRVLCLHPGIDNSFECGHTISTLGSIKAFEPVHGSILSAERNVASASRYCISF